MNVCLATLLKRSRRELAIDVAEHRYILKYYQNTYHPRFAFKPKAGIAFYKTGVLFTLSRRKILNMSIYEKRKIRL